jgi:3,4-dihydroxy 2-butanone 4-phosphate synthase/GTP cyclohydrolase II
VALVHGDLSRSDEPVLVRMHTHCFAGDVFHASSCECASYIRASLQRIAEEGRGTLIYLHQNSLGFAFENVLGTDKLQFHHEEKNLGSPEHRRRIQREVGVGAQILLDLGLRRIRLLTDHPRRIAALEGYDIEIVEHSPLSPIETRAFVSLEEDVLFEAKLSRR